MEFNQNLALLKEDEREKKSFEFYQVFESKLNDRKKEDFQQSLKNKENLRIFSLNLAVCHNTYTVSNNLHTDD